MTFSRRLLVCRRDIEEDSNFIRGKFGAKAIFALTAGSILICAPVRAESIFSLSGIASCVEKIETPAPDYGVEPESRSETDSAISTGRCIAAQMINEALDGSMAKTNEFGKKLLGQNFAIHNRLVFSLHSGGGLKGLSGDWDAVMPVSFSAFAIGGQQIKGSLFFQQGITRWRDPHDLWRNDMRYGLVHRFALSGQKSDGEKNTEIIGISSFYQHNPERGHQRLVSGFDYAGTWGDWSFNYFMPLTDWLPGRTGFEERALEGMELKFLFNLTTTIDYNITASRWEKEDDPSQWIMSGSLGLNWSPSSWVKFNSNWGITDQNQYPFSVKTQIKIPLSGGKILMPAPWQGLGFVGVSAAQDSSKMWRPVENIGKIKYAERTVAEPVRDATIRFLHDRVLSGKSVELEVTLSSAVSQDVKLTVRLMPGSGDSPAVPGEDYFDQDIEITMRKGQSRATASIQLPHNPNMKRARSLSAAISLPN